MFPKDMAQGNKKAISKSKIINKIATKKNLTSNSILESLKASKPHSYAESFSASGFFGENKKFNTTNPTLNPKAINRKIIIDR